jgi:hypothetical protein
MRCNSASDQCWAVELASARKRSTVYSDLRARQEEVFKRIMPTRWIAERISAFGDAPQEPLFRVNPENRCSKSSIRMMFLSSVSDISQNSAQE